MSFSQGVSLYLVWNLLFGVGFFLLLGRGVALGWRKVAFSPVGELRLHLRLWAVPFVVVGALLVLPPLRSPLRLSEVDAAPSLRFYQGEAPILEPMGYLSLRGRPSHHFPVSRLRYLASLFLYLLAATGVSFFLRDGFRIFCTLRHSFFYRKIGRVRIWLNAQTKIPFSFWFAGRAHIVIPDYLVARPQHFKIALLHEIQHHRNHDTKVIYFIWFARLSGVFNPAIHYWARWIGELQEFACDATLVDRNKVESRQYGRCLFEVAQHAREERAAPSCATGLALFFGGNLLKRRIEKMIASPSSESVRSTNWIFLSVATLLLSLTAMASHGLIQDRRITMREAQAWASRHQQESAFPLIVNDLVLTELNRYLGTPDGREYMRKALARMKDYSPILEKSLERYHVPRELLAVPIIESGYQNLPDKNQAGWGAGLWMFMKRTAQAVGLSVDEIKDERLDVEKLTDAAMRLLLANRLRFNDWLLSLLAYNWGENGLQEAMAKTHSRDAWVLARKGYKGDKDYLAKFTAAALIMKNPQTLD